LGTTKVLSLMAVASLVVLAVLIAYSIEAEAHSNKDKNTTKIINLGILQTAAHDFFNVHRCLESVSRAPIPGCVVFDEENRLLDLSTVLFNPKSDPITGEPLCDFKKALAEESGCELYDDDQIANGGEPRNGENIMIFTAASKLGEKYLKLEEKHGPEKAYDKILKKYHKQIKKAFIQTFHQKFPKAQEGLIDANHNLALRSVHDFLPGTIMKEGVSDPVSVFQFPPEKLSKKEQRQPSGPLDGLFDPAFLPITFCIPPPPGPPPPVPPVCIVLLNLQVVDSDFATQFGTTHSFEHFMIETSDGKFNKNEDVTKLIIELFARGINLS